MSTSHTRKLWQAETQCSINNDTFITTADQSLFRTVLTKDNHVMHRLLPPNKTLQYKLRPRNHNLTLTCKSSYYDSSNFISRMLFSEAYWRSCLFTYVLLFYFSLYTMFSALSHTCVCANAVCHWFIKLLSDLIWTCIWSIRRWSVLFCCCAVRNSSSRDRARSGNVARATEKRQRRLYPD